MDHAIQSNLAVDLCHALLIGCSNSTAAKHDIHLFEGQPLGLWNEESDKARPHENEDTKEYESAFSMLVSLIS